MALSHFEDVILECLQDQLDEDKDPTPVLPSPAPEPKSETSHLNQTVMLLVPCFFLWIFALLERYYIKRSNTERCSCLEQNPRMLPRLWMLFCTLTYLSYIHRTVSNCRCRNWMNRMKLVSLDILVLFCHVEVVIGVYDMFYCWSDEAQVNVMEHVIYIWSHFIQLVTFVLAFYLVDRNTREGLRSSGVIFLFWLLFCVIWGATITLKMMGAIRLQFQNIHSPLKGQTTLQIYVLKYIFMVTNLALNFFAEPTSELPQLSDNVFQSVSPLKTSSFPSRMTFVWATPLVLKAAVYKTVQTKHLWSLEPEIKVQEVYKRFHDQWINRLTLGDEQSIIWPLMRAFFPAFIFVISLRVVLTLLVIFHPYLIMKVNELMEQSTVLLHAYLSVGVMLTYYIAKNIVKHQLLFEMTLLDMRIQSVLYSAIYKKVLRLPYSYRKENSVKEVVKLMSEDVDQAKRIIYHMNELWTVVELIGILILLGRDQGMYPMIWGASILSVILLLSQRLKQRNWNLQQNHSNLRDERVKLTHEVLLNIKGIKLNLLESYFEERIESTREKEIQLAEHLDKSQLMHGHILLPVLILYLNMINIILMFLHNHDLVSLDSVLQSGRAGGMYWYFTDLFQPLSSLSNALDKLKFGGPPLRRINDFLNAEEMPEQSLNGDDNENSSRDPPMPEDEVSEREWKKYSVDTIIAKMGRKHSNIPVKDKRRGTDRSNNSVNLCILDPDETSYTEEVKLRTYKDYIKSSWCILLIAFSLMLCNISLIFDTVWYIGCAGSISNMAIEGACEPSSKISCQVKCCNDTLWARIKSTNLLSRLKILKEDDIILTDNVSKVLWSWVYFFRIFTIGIISVLVSAGVEILVRSRLTNHSIFLHKEMLHGILSAPFFRSDSVSRVISCSTHDIPVLDHLLPRNVYSIVLNAAGTLSSFILLYRYEEEIAGFVIMIFIIYIWFMCFYFMATRQLKRNEIVSFSQLATLLSEGYKETSTRAYNFQKRQEKEFDEKIDLLQTYNYLRSTFNIWFSIWVEFLGRTVFIISSLYGLYRVKHHPEQFDGFFILLSSILTHYFEAFLVAFGRIEDDMLSLQRVKEYQFTNQDKEKAKQNCITRLRFWLNPMSKGASQHALNLKGKLEMRHLSVRYEKHQEFVMKDINFTVEPRQKVGVVGRTGAGKSTLALVVFGALRPARGRGQVFIDDKDISQVPLSVLRSQLSIITQDPFVFSGTLRMNLDPVKTKSDHEILEAVNKFLDIRQFRELISRQTNCLDYVISDGGRNLSLGQKQVMCIVRVLLLKRKLIIMDEATSSLGPDDDRVIHKVLSKEFKDSTVINISHWFNSLLGYDRVMVIDNGRIMEFNSKDKLLNDPSSVLFKMVQTARQLDDEKYCGYSQNSDPESEY